MTPNIDPSQNRAQKHSPETEPRDSVSNSIEKSNLPDPNDMPDTRLNVANPYPLTGPALGTLKKALEWSELVVHREKMMRLAKIDETYLGKEAVDEIVEELEVDQIPVLGVHPDKLVELASVLSETGELIKNDRRLSRRNQDALSSLYKKTSDLVHALAASLNSEPLMKDYLDRPSPHWYFEKTLSCSKDLMEGKNPKPHCYEEVRPIGGTFMSCPTVLFGAAVCTGFVSVGLKKIYSLVSEGQMELWSGIGWGAGVVVVAAAVFLGVCHLAFPSKIKFHINP